MYWMISQFLWKLVQYNIIGEWDVQLLYRAGLLGFRYTFTCVLPFLLSSWNGKIRRFTNFINMVIRLFLQCSFLSLKNKLTLERIVGCSGPVLCCLSGTNNLPCFLCCTVYSKLKSALIQLVQNYLSNCKCSFNNATYECELCVCQCQGETVWWLALCDVESRRHGVKQRTPPRRTISLQHLNSRHNTNRCYDLDRCLAVHPCVCMQACFGVCMCVCVCSSIPNSIKSSGSSSESLLLK